MCVCDDVEFRKLIKGAAWRLKYVNLCDEVQIQAGRDNPHYQAAIQHLPAKDAHILYTRGPEAIYAFTRRQNAGRKYIFSFKTLSSCLAKGYGFLGSPDTLIPELLKNVHIQ